MLAHAVKDEDADVRTSALQALRRYGPLAGPAAVKVGEAVKTSDLDMRLLGIRVLVVLDREGRVASPVLIAALRPPSRPSARPRPRCSAHSAARIGRSARHCGRPSRPGRRGLAATPALPCWWGYAPSKTIDHTDKEQHPLPRTGGAAVGLVQGLRFP